MSSFIDSGVGIASPMYMVRFSSSIEQQKQSYNCKADNLGVVWCSRRIVYEFTDRLLIYHLYGKTAELYLANS